MNKILLFKNKFLKDSRGHFIKYFPLKDLRITKNFNIKEFYITKSKKNTIRGMHLQISKKSLNKIVFVYYGEILDVVVDLRKKSKNFKKYFCYKLSHINNSSLYIPKGFAHGFLVLSDYAIVGYLTDEAYDFKYDTGFHYNSFNFPWKKYIKKNNKKIVKEIISKRDRNLIEFNKFRHYV